MLGADPLGSSSFKLITSSVIRGNCKLWWLCKAAFVSLNIASSVLKKTVDIYLNKFEVIETYMNIVFGWGNKPSHYLVSGAKVIDIFRHIFGGHVSFIG